MFCTYLTIYSGSLLPKRYIGSSSLERVKNGYHGSVKSKKHEDKWNKELKENPHLFKTRVLTLHETREQAFEKELELQQCYNVVKNSNYTNEAYACRNGCFGRDVSGENNPMFGKTQPPHVGEAVRKSRTGKKDKESTIIKKSNSRKGELNPMFGKTGENSPLYGRKRPEHSELMKEKMKGNDYGSRRSTEGVKKCAEAAKKANSQKHKCHLCGKSTNKGNLARWHGIGKCKQ